MDNRDARFLCLETACESELISIRVEDLRMKNHIKEGDFEVVNDAFKVHDLAKKRRNNDDGNNKKRGSQKDIAPDNFHMGDLIKAELKNQERSISWLARKIGCDSSCLSRHLKNRYVELSIIINSSVALGCNFGNELQDYIKYRIEIGC